MSVDEPFLPPPEPTDNPPAQPKKSGRKTIVLWILLIVMFVAIYQFFTPDQNHHHAAPPPPCTNESSWGTVLYWLAPLGLLIGVFSWFRWLARGGARFNLDQEPALVALAEGQLERAASGFAEVVAKHKSAHYQAVARHNLATVRLRQGDLKAALEETVRVEKGGGLLWASEIRLLAAIFFAEVYALKGELGPAERWIADARRRLKKSGSRHRSAALLRLSEAMVECRQGRFAEALRGLERDWRQLEGTLSVSWMRNAWLIRAFAATQLDGPREANAAPLLPLLRSQPPGVYDYLAVEWPELRTFLVASSLSTAA